MARPDAALLGWSVQKLAAAFPPSFRDEGAIKAKAVLLAELCQQHSWVSADVLRKGIYLAVWQHQSAYAPAPAVLLDFFEAARVELERETRARSRKLPPPPPPTADERQTEEDRVVALKLAARLSLPERFRARRKR